MKSFIKAKRPKELAFSVDGQLMGELGEKLVTKNYIALSELVKNAYDADAKFITLEFHNVRSKTKKQKSSRQKSSSNPLQTLGKNAYIVISDKGEGMLHEQVRDHWMRIATPNKARDPISKLYGRYKTGSKGIGRLACQRLGKRLILRTVGRTAHNTLEQTTVTFDWSRFKAGEEISDILFQPVVEQVFNIDTGTELTIHDLTEPWSVLDFNTLRRHLVTLAIAASVRRKGFKEDPGFEVLIRAPDFKSEGILLSSQILDAGWGLLVGSVDVHGNVHLDLQSKATESKEKSTKDSDIRTTHILPERFPNAKAAKFEISFIPSKAEYLRDPTTLKVGVVQQLSKDFGGVRIYLDGFRVYPYGEPEDDWLGLDRDVARRAGAIDSALKSLATKLHLDPGRVMLDSPRHRNLLGTVHISSKETPQFVIKMDREGLVENKAFLQLIRAVRLSIEWMTLQFAVYKRRGAEKQANESRQEFMEAMGSSSQDPKIAVKKAIVFLERNVKSKPKTKKDQEMGRKLAPKAARVIKDEFDRIEAERAQLLIVASTAPLLVLFSHEVRSVIGWLHTHAARLKHIASKMRGESAQELSDIVSEMKASGTQLGQLVELVSMVGAPNKLERVPISVVAVVQQVLSGFNLFLEKSNITHQVLVPPSLKTPPMVQSEVMSILINLLSNAAKAVIAKHGSRICIEAMQDTKGLYLFVMDDGVGIPEKYREMIFDSMVSDPANNLYPRLRTALGDESLVSLGKGTGLGLTIVRSIASSYGGTARVVSKIGWTTGIEVFLPWETQ